MSSSEDDWDPDRGIDDSSSSDDSNNETNVDGGGRGGGNGNIESESVSDRSNDGYGQDEAHALSSLKRGQWENNHSSARLSYDPSDEGNNATVVGNSSTPADFKDINVCTNRRGIKQSPSNDYDGNDGDDDGSCGDENEDREDDDDFDPLRSFYDEALRNKEIVAFADSQPFSQLSQLSHSPPNVKGVTLDNEHSQQMTQPSQLLQFSQLSQHTGSQSIAELTRLQHDILTQTTDQGTLKSHRELEDERQRTKMERREKRRAMKEGLPGRTKKYKRVVKPEKQIKRHMSVVRMKRKRVDLSEEVDVGSVGFIASGRGGAASKGTTEEMGPMEYLMRKKLETPEEQRRLKRMAKKRHRQRKKEEMEAKLKKEETTWKILNWTSPQQEEEGERLQEKLEEEGKIKVDGDLEGAQDSSDKEGAVRLKEKKEQNDEGISDKPNLENQPKLDKTNFHIPYHRFQKYTASTRKSNEFNQEPAAILDPNWNYLEEGYVTMPQAHADQLPYYIHKNSKRKSGMISVVEKGGKLGRNECDSENSPTVKGEGVEKSRRKIQDRKSINRRSGESIRHLLMFDADNNPNQRPPVVGVDRKQQLIHTMKQKEEGCCSHNYAFPLQLYQHKPILDLYSNVDLRTRGRDRLVLAQGRNAKRLWVRMVAGGLGMDTVDMADSDLAESDEGGGANGLFGISHAEVGMHHAGAMGMAGTVGADGPAGFPNLEKREGRNHDSISNVSSSSDGSQSLSPSSSSSSSGSHDLYQTIHNSQETYGTSAVIVDTSNDINDGNSQVGEYGSNWKDDSCKRKSNRGNPIFRLMKMVHSLPKQAHRNRLLSKITMESGTLRLIWEMELKSLLENVGEIGNVRKAGKDGGVVLTQKEEQDLITLQLFLGIPSCNFTSFKSTIPTVSGPPWACDPIAPTDPNYIKERMKCFRRWFVPRLRGWVRRKKMEWRLSTEAGIEGTGKVVEGALREEVIMKDDNGEVGGGSHDDKNEASIGTGMETRDKRERFSKEKEFRANEGIMPSKEADLDEQEIDPSQNYSEIETAKFKGKATLPKEDPGLSFEDKDWAGQPNEEDTLNYSSILTKQDFDEFDPNQSSDDTGIRAAPPTSIPESKNSLNVSCAERRDKYFRMIHDSNIDISNIPVAIASFLDSFTTSRVLYSKFRSQLLQLNDPLESKTHSPHGYDQIRQEVGETEKKKAKKQAKLAKKQCGQWHQATLSYLAMAENQAALPDTYFFKVDGQYPCSAPLAAVVAMGQSYRANGGGVGYGSNEEEKYDGPSWEGKKSKEETEESDSEDDDDICSDSGDASEEKEADKNDSNNSLKPVLGKKSLNAIHKSAKDIVMSGKHHLTDKFLNLFPGIYLPVGVAMIAERLPPSAAEIISRSCLFSPCDEPTLSHSSYHLKARCTPFDLLRATLHHIEEKNLLIPLPTNEQSRRNLHEKVIDEVVVECMNEAAAVFKKCIETDPSDVNLWSWYVASVLGVVSLSSGFSLSNEPKICTSPVKMEDNHSEHREPKRRRKRPQLECFEDKRKEASRAMLDFFNVVGKEGCPMFHLAVTSMLEWREAIALFCHQPLIFESAQEDFGFDVQQLHAYHTFQWAKRDCTTISTVIARELYEARRLPRDALLEILAISVEQKPCDRINWHRLTSVLGPVGVFESTDVKEKMEEVDELYEGFCAPSISKKGQGNGRWCRKDRISEWEDRFFNAPESSHAIAKPEFVKMIIDALDTAPWSPSISKGNQNKTPEVSGVGSGFSWDLQNCMSWVHHWLKDDRRSDDGSNGDINMDVPFDFNLLPSNICELSGKNMSWDSSKSTLDHRLSRNPHCEALCLKVLVACHMAGISHPFVSDCVWWMAVKFWHSQRAHRPREYFLDGLLWLSSHGLHVPKILHQRLKQSKDYCKNNKGVGVDL